jgi:predicted RNA-binding Zn ribbon-like protein
VPRYDVPNAAPGALRAVQLFVNSVDHEHGREWWPTPAALAAWLEEHGLGASATVTSGGLRRAVQLREALRALLLANNGGEVSPVAIDAINEAARRASVAIVLDVDGHPVVAACARSTVDVALGRIVASVFEAMLDGSWLRLKACRNCEWAYYDYSRNRAASWCSMSICGNRLKTRSYRRRRAARKEELR